MCCDMTGDRIISQAVRKERYPSVAGCAGALEFSRSGDETFLPEYSLTGDGSRNIDFQMQFCYHGTTMNGFL